MLGSGSGEENFPCIFIIFLFPLPWKRVKLTFHVNKLHQRMLCAKFAMWFQRRFLKDWPLIPLSKIKSMNALY